MIEKLKLKIIYDDFCEKVALTDEQKKIIKMLINRDSIVKISMEIGISERTLSYEIKKLKKLYSGYIKLERVKLEVLLED